MKRLALALVLVPAIAAAQVPDSVAYRVKANDTFSIIASEFYGDRLKASFILAENKIVHAKPLQRGQVLRVPAMRELVTAPGDTFQSVALATLDSVDRGDILAEVNNMSPDDNLPAGTSILIPFTVTHTAQGTEDLEAIAANYYGDRKLASVLRKYNKLDKKALEKNDQIIVPAYNVKMHPARILPPKDPESAKRRDRQREMSRLAATTIPSARHAWRIGEFAAIKAALEPIDTSYVELGAAIDIGVLLGSAHVALGESEEALVAFKKVLDRKPSHTLRKIDHSPKVLAVWTKAVGLVE
jgi:LysM repeat protein